MTEWREWPAWRQLAAAALDRVSGAAVVGESSARALGELVEAIVDLSPEDYPLAVTDALRLLLAHHSSMAPVANLANAVYLTLPEGPDAVVKTLHEMALRLAESTEALGRAGARLVPERATVLTHSASSSVASVLVEAMEERRPRVCCTEALPDGEGLMMAADLAAAGLEVEVIPDDSVTDVMEGVDLVMVGADALGPDAAINKLGTVPLALEAARIGLPFYLVASREKVLPARLFDRAAASRGRDELFDVFPLSFATAVISEDGPISPDEVRRLAADRPVAAELARADSKG